MPVTKTKRLLSLLACTALCATLHISMAVGREQLGVSSWNVILFFIAHFTGYMAITIISVATYRWLVDEQKMEVGVGWEAHLFLTIGTPCLVTRWSYTESFPRIFGSRAGGGGG